MRVATITVLGFLVVMSAQRNSANGRAGSSSIGPQIGKKAPAFTAHDQFGHEQTNETLRGPNGTVLLFFRSADW
jgi:cytochrome oxidase Cu insertion factor (SCO1/SenC/PrrC family)